MNLKLLIFRTRSKGVPVYCCFLFLVYLVYNSFYSSPQHTDRVPTVIQRYVKFSKPLSFPEVALSRDKINKLISITEMMNFEREVLQAWRYGAVRADTDMLVVQVHRDVERLQFLIVALAEVRYIQSVLLVFSHSYYDDVINKLVTSITFCRVLQIFYPYSFQLYPNKFPGIDPDDCLSGYGTADCSHRDGRLTEHKHHWWWKAFFIFNCLDWSDDYKGTVIFLEEDNYVLPDLLHMLRYTKRSKVYLQGIQVMSFGRPYTKAFDYDLLSVSAWRPPYDKGLAFNKTVWQQIAAQSAHYCKYDDLSWSYSLLHAFGRFHSGRADMVAVEAPRVLSTGLYPSGRAAMQQIKSWMDGAQMFPVKVKAVMLYGSMGRVDPETKPPPAGNGGWSDMRDHLLCLDPLRTTTATTYHFYNVTSNTDYNSIDDHKSNNLDTLILS